MIGLKHPGHDAVLRFVRGHYYHLEKPSNKDAWRLMRFEKRVRRAVIHTKDKKQSCRGEYYYCFVRVAGDETLKTPHIAFSSNIIHSSYVWEVPVDDLPLYIGRKSIYPAFKEALVHYGDENSRRHFILKRRRYRKKIK